MAFQSAKSVGQQELIRADYERVLNFEEDDYISLCVRIDVSEA